MVGTCLRRGMVGRVAKLRLLDLQPLDAEHEQEEVIVGNIRDQESLYAAMQGAHGVVHLAGIADEADFHDLVEVNILGTYNVLEAARRAGVSRVVYASSNRVAGFYSTDVVVNSDMPPRPDGFYGVSKVTGEALGRLYADKFGLQVAAVRIGSFEDAPLDIRQLSTWLSHADCVAAFLAAMTTPNLTFASFYAVSRNQRRWWDIDNGALIGFEPRDDAEAFADVLRDSPCGSQPGLQGGHYTEASYTLDRQIQTQSDDVLEKVPSAATALDEALER